MNRHLIPVAVFLAGLAVVAWVGWGYVGTNSLALAVIAVIGAFYVGAAVELHRYRQATDTLGAAVAGLPGASSDLESWLVRVHPGLRDAVRLRVQGSRAALPGPALTPYVVGLLVLLGMLGTFLGMIATLRGTGAALAGATDLQAIRASLAAPVLGLGFAFGTSVAGVAASAALGLLAALCRREREEVARRLDAGIASSLQAYTPARQREEVLALLRGQAGVMPQLVDRLHALTEALTQQSRVQGERLAADQQAFHEKAETAYARLAESVAASLADSVAASAHAAGEAIRPAVETAMAGMSREASAWQDAISQTAHRQLDDVSVRFDAAAAGVAERWQSALAQQQQVNDAMVETLKDVQQRFAEAFEQRAAGLVDAVSARLSSATDGMAGAWREAIDGQSRTAAALAEENRRVLDEAATAMARQGGELVGMLGDSQAAWRAELAEQERQRLDAWAESLDGMLAQLRQELAEAGERSARQHREICDALAEAGAQVVDRQQGIGETLVKVGDQVADRQREICEELGKVGAQVVDRQREICDELAKAGSQVVDRQRDIGETLARVGDQVADRQREICDELGKVGMQVVDRQREICEELARTGEQVSAHQRGIGEVLAQAGSQVVDRQREICDEMAKAGAQVADRQREVCDALAQLAQNIAVQTREQASGTLAEIGKLASQAAEAPKAAAEVIGELRQRLSDSLQHDNAVLEERNRLLDTLGTLLDAVNHASTEQRTAIDGLVTASADLLERVGSRFSETVETQAGRLESAAVEAASGAAEVASLGEAFGSAVQAYGESNDKMAEHLERVGAALTQATSRSDEQLAYYVAQAREVVDLSLMAQKQIMEDLQRLAEQRAAPGAGAA